MTSSVNVDFKESIVNISQVTREVKIDWVKGLRGEKGPAGESANVDNLFQIINNFSELNTAEKKAAARENLELQYIDCGTFN